MPGPLSFSGGGSLESGALVATDTDDRTMPAEYIGHPIAPNYYCRAWNPRRSKYCRSRAGTGTDHVGDGRCSIHHGNAAVKHGLRRRYQFTTKPIAELLERHESDETPLDIRPEIALLRALSEDFIERHSLTSEQLSAWHAQRRLDPEQMRAMYAMLDEFEAMRNGDRTVRQDELLSLARAAVQHLGEDIARPSQVPDLADAVKLISETTRSVERVYTMQSKAAITYEQLKRFLFAVDRILETRVNDVALLARIKDDIMRLGI